MNVFCIRHGVTYENARGIFCGHGGGGLTTEQREQLCSLDFAVSRFDAIYCSPAPRCRETALCLGALAFVEDGRLAERDFGIFDGHTPEHCRRAFPDHYAAFRRLDGDFVIPMGESRAQHLDRVMEWLREVSAIHESVLAFTHGGIVDFFFRLGSGLELHGGSEVFAGPNAAISEFEVVWPRVSVNSHGRLLADLFGRSGDDDDRRHPGADAVDRGV